MYYTVYKITNIINGKTYIGKHKTKNLDDGYMGSGKLIQIAIKKYGKHNFLKEYIGFYNSIEEMNEAERHLISENKNSSYNLAPGGYGGTFFISEETKKKLSIIASNRKGKIIVSDETKKETFYHSFK